MTAMDSESMDETLQTCRGIYFSIVAGFGLIAVGIAGFVVYDDQQWLDYFNLEIHPWWIHGLLIGLVILALVGSFLLDSSLLKSFRHTSANQEHTTQFFEVLQRRTVFQLSLGEATGTIGIIGFGLTGSLIDLIIVLLPVGYLFYRVYPSRKKWIRLARSEGIEPSIKDSSTKTAPL